MENFNYGWVKDPAFFADNRVSVHSGHRYFETKEKMEQNIEDFRYSLNGLWKFHYAKNYQSTVPGFEKADYCCKTWDDIRVPAHIQLEGYDLPQYANVQYPWEGHEEVVPGEIPVRFNPVASYVKYFTVPEHMRGKRIFGSFQGAESGLALWLNGTYVGYSEDSFMPSEFELTPYLKEGENKLAAQVFKWTSGSWCEDQDFFRFSGIYRDVYLYAIPDIHVKDIRVRTLLDDTFTSAELEVTLRATASGRARLTLTGLDGTRMTQETALGEETVCRMQVAHPALWSAEAPNLYELLIEVLGEDGALREVIPQKVGFRRFELKDHVMTLNGKRIVFKGVNRHEFSAAGGRCVSREEMLQDLATMKQNNINAIRTSHYPNSTDLYDLCDEYGLYLIAECNMETHGTWDVNMLTGDHGRILPNDRTEWRELLLDRVNSTYQRDKNHPSILIWSCGNESFGGKVIYEMSQLYRKLDPDRLVHYEGIFVDRRYNETSDIESQMYPPVENIVEFLKKDRSKPFICCEYAHAMGNSCGAMHKYTDLTDTEPLYQGGFIWDYIDQSLWKKDRYGSWFQAYGGDFGDRPTDYNFSGNGIVYGDRKPSPKMQEVKFNYQNITAQVGKHTVKVINKHLFTNTDAFDCLVILEREGKRIRTAPLRTHTAPLSEDVYELPIPQAELPGEYAVTVSFRLKEDTLWGKRGHEVAFGQGVYQITAADKETGRTMTEHGEIITGFGETMTESGQMMPGSGQMMMKSGEMMPESGETMTESGETMTESREMMAESGEMKAESCQTIEAGNAAGKNFEVVNSLHNLGVRGENFEVLFSHLNGGLVSYRYGGKEMMEAIPMPNFWRAPTDNDRGNLMPMRYAQWKTASLYLGHKVPSGDRYPDMKLPKIEVKEDYAEIAFTYAMPTVPASECVLTYRVYGDGEVRTTLSYDPVKELGDMPEFGVIFKLNADYDHLTWYGLGPEETYVDRCRGAKLGIYQNQVKDNMAKYLVPQECGNKIGVRWAKVTDRRGRGLLYFGDQMEFSALPYTPHELENAAHPFELPPVHYTVVRVSAQQMGVGGDDSWGALTHPEYLLDCSKKMEFTFSFRGI